MDRVKTHIERLDDILGGGLPKGNIVLVSGSAGVGKSIFCLNILYNNALKKKKVSYISFEEKESSLKEQMKSFGWNYNKVKKYLDLCYFEVSDPKVFEKIKKHTKGKELVAIDSISAFLSLPKEIRQVQDEDVDNVLENMSPIPFDSEMISRMKARDILENIRGAGITSLVVSEVPSNIKAYSRDMITEFLGDGIIHLMIDEFGGMKKRVLEIIKMRRSKIDLQPYVFDISSKGIELLKRIGL